MVAVAIQKHQNFKHCHPLTGITCGSQIYTAECASNGLDREIERLRTRIKNIELDQAQQSSKIKKGHYTASSEDGKFSKSRWQGSGILDPLSGKTTYFGPTSSPHLVHRMSHYIGKTLEKPFPTELLQPQRRSAHLAFLAHQDEDPGGLSRTQEETFINLFWQFCHCIIPIVSESEFRVQYNFLWLDLPPNSSKRKPSALVDIILALCMQFGTVFMGLNQRSEDEDSNIDPINFPVTGSRYYRRCQDLISLDLEAPSIDTLRCHLFSTVYLYNASLMNMAHSRVAVAVRTAHMLGLHHNAPSDLPTSEQQLHKRIWWSTYLLDSQISMDVGRPLMICTLETSCELPKADKEHANLSGSQLKFDDETFSWLSFQVQSIKLSKMTRDIYTDLHHECSRILEVTGSKNIYDDQNNLEMLAIFLRQQIARIDFWVRGVPEPIKIKRENGVEPFSTHRSRFQIDVYSPLWLQRQSLLLELMYHNLVMSLFRPFLRFPPVQVSLTPTCDSHCISALNHAMTITALLNQVLSETDIMNGFYQTYRYQWDSTICMLGFVLAHPACPPTPSARNGLQKALANLEILGTYFSDAVSATNSVREAIKQIGILADKFRASLPFQAAETISWEQGQSHEEIRKQRARLKELSTQKPLEDLVQQFPLQSSGDMSSAWTPASLDEPVQHETSANASILDISGFPMPEDLDLSSAVFFNSEWSNVQDDSWMEFFEGLN